MPALENLTAALLNFKGAYMFGLHGAKDADLFKLFSAESPSTGAENIYEWFGEMPDMRLWVGDRIAHQLDGHEFRIKNEPYELTIEIDEKKYLDNQLPSLRPRFEAMGAKVALKPNQICFDVLNNGKTMEGYDEVPLWSTSHPGKDGVQSNYRTGANEPWVLVDNSRTFGLPVIYQPRQAPRYQRFDRPTDPTVFWKGKMIWGADRRDGAAPGLWQTALLSEEALNATNFATAFAQMAAFKNDDGELMEISPKVILTTSANWAAADALFNKPFLAGGETNTHAGRVRVVLTDRLNIV